MRLVMHREIEYHHSGIIDHSFLTFQLRPIHRFRSNITLGVKHRMRHIELLDDKDIFMLPGQRSDRCGTRIILFKLPRHGIIPRKTPDRQCLREFFRGRT
ncbi:hypothetical protein SDC9_198283 [bioreactor metagenome]|uniref:Uncharacterized protein n=1 Tax=bioreactor metagenome TaxID=1076179 RepID=A0A645IH77_9ZZZZ